MRSLWFTALLTAACSAASAIGIASTTRAAPVRRLDATYSDPYPLPLDTLHVRMKEVGTHGGRFVVAQAGAPRTFNAMMANETSSQDVTGRLFASLVYFSRVTLRTESSLAKSWRRSPDGLTWTFQLRRGARFSDGQPITSTDVHWDAAQGGGGPFNAFDITKVPVAVTVFPGEIYRAPRSWGEQVFKRLIYWNEVDRGGHFAANEVPQLFAEEMRAAFRSIRAKTAEATR